MSIIEDFFLGPTVTKSNYLYKTPHLITLAIVLVATLLVVFIFNKKSMKAKRTFLWIMVSILLVLEITSRVVHFIKGGDFFSSTVIPMHFCSIMVWMIIIATFTNNKHMYTLSAMGGLIATIAFLLYPSVGFNKEVLKFSQYYSIISHSIGFVVSIFLITGGFASFKLKNIWIGAVFLVANYIYAFLLNYWLMPNNNFMYYSENLLPVPFGVWILIYILFVLTYFSSFYFVTYLKDRKRKKSAT